MTQISNTIVFVIWSLELIWDFKFGDWNFCQSQEEGFVEVVQFGSRISGKQCPTPLLS
jgi:hypothetical protein